MEVCHASGILRPAPADGGNDTAASRRATGATTASGPSGPTRTPARLRSRNQSGPVAVSQASGLSTAACCRADDCDLRIRADRTLMQVRCHSPRPARSVCGDARMRHARPCAATSGQCPCAARMPGARSPKFGVVDAVPRQVGGFRPLKCRQTRELFDAMVSCTGNDVRRQPCMRYGHPNSCQICRHRLSRCNAVPPSPRPHPERSICTRPLDIARCIAGSLLCSVNWRGAGGKRADAGRASARAHAGRIGAHNDWLVPRTVFFPMHLFALTADAGMPRHVLTRGSSGAYGRRTE